MLERIFKLKENNTTLRHEIIGGVTTFLTMAYIVFLHPNMLSETGMDKGALITVTCLSSFIGTLFVALWANVPFALAPGLGLNSFFTYSIVQGMGIPWQTALGIVFVSGVLFLILSLVGFREKIVNAIPLALRLAVPAGIGLLIAFVGFRNMGLVITHESTFLALGSFSQTVLISIGGLAIIIVLDLYKIKGSILIGIVLVYLAAILLGEIALPGTYISSPPTINSLAFQLDILGALKLGFIGAIFSFLFVDLFDSVGTIIGCAYEAKLVNSDGTIKKIDRILTSDASATIIGSLLGTSTVTTYIESASGIASGARTGLASMVTAFLFLLAPFFAPLIGSVPGYATAPALVIIGLYMFRNIHQINFSDLSSGIPAFLTITIMPFTGSISTGLSFGFISYIILQIFEGNTRQIPLTLWIIGIMTVLNLIL